MEWGAQIFGHKTTELLRIQVLASVLEYPSVVEPIGCW